MSNAKNEYITDTNKSFQSLASNALFKDSRLRTNFLRVNLKKASHPVPFDEF